MNETNISQMQRRVERVTTPNHVAFSPPESLFSEERMALARSASSEVLKHARRWRSGLCELMRELG